jgi:serine/threonine-protein kinase
MSPEQIKGLSTTPRTDIYSLGITLYEMLSGKVPFYFNNDYDIYEAHLKMQPQKLSTIYPEIPKEIDELILSALNKSETKNFATAYEFRTSVEHLILNLPLLMSDATNIKESHSHKKVIKNKPVNFAIALIILLTILISVFSYYLVDKFIIKEEMSRIYEDKSNINYFSERKYFTAPWEFLSTNISENVNAICSNDSKIFVGSSGGKILISTDQGNSWIKSAETSTSGINKLVPVNNKIYATTDDGHFIVLNQNGKVNEKIKLNNENLTSLNIGNNILICGTNGLVLKSEKDRINFQKISFPNNITIYDIIELDKTIFLCCTWDGKVFKTNDEGKTWTSEKLSNDYLKKIFFLN